jgi:hypothetical protein
VSYREQSGPIGGYRDQNHFFRPPSKEQFLSGRAKLDKVFGLGQL